MDLQVKSVTPESARTQCLIVGVHDRRKLSDAAAAVDKASAGALTRVLKSGDMDGKAGQTQLVHGLTGVSASRVLLVGMGSAKDGDEANYLKCITAAFRALRSTKATDAICMLTALEVAKRDEGWKQRIAAIAINGAYYRFDECRGEKARADQAASSLKKAVMALGVKEKAATATAGLQQGQAIAAGQSLAKDLGNRPGNHCTPTHMADVAKSLARGQRSPLKVKILEEAAMRKLGMGSLLSVSAGSAEPAKLIVLEYMKGKKSQKPIALVGKGVTFDTGGISLKPGAGMDEMKFDMCGSAAVMGAMKALVEMKLPINVVGVIGATENMPGSRATKPGDVVTSMSGQTIEILNTDAEGRLVLCDALTYTEQNYQPSACIDMATLTGACVVALGSYPSGLFSNDEKLCASLKSAAEESLDRVWELPLWSDYDDHLKSECADIANIATRNGREGGAIIAACFLHRFTRNMKWAHLDIAGSAWTGKQASGRPVSLLMHYLMEQAGK